MKTFLSLSFPLVPLLFLFRHSRVPPRLLLFSPSVSGALEGVLGVKVSVIICQTAHNPRDKGRQSDGCYWPPPFIQPAKIPVAGKAFKDSEPDRWITTRLNWLLARGSHSAAAASVSSFACFRAYVASMHVYRSFLLTGYYCCFDPDFSMEEFFSFSMK